MWAISAKSDAVVSVPHQTIGLPGRIGIRGAVAQVMLDFKNLAVGRFEEVQDRGAEVLARNKRRWKAGPSSVRPQPVIAHRISLLCACDARAKGKATICRAEGVAFDGAVEDVVAIEEASDVGVGGAIVDLGGPAELAHPAAIEHYETITHRESLG